MCDQRWMLENFVAIIPGSWEVSGIGDSKVQALGHGDVPIDVQKGDETRPGTIRNVLYVPGLGINLLSVGSVTDQGRSVIFKEIEVTVNRENDVLMTGSRVGMSLYRLNISPRAPSAQKMALAAASTVSNASLVLWHKRLAHINYKSIIRMAGKDAVRGLQLAEGVKPPNELCAGCALGKMHRLPFPAGRERATVIGGLVHSDLCGPMDRETPKGARYCVGFKDDYSGYCLVYFIRQKSEVLEQYKTFERTMLSETGRKIKILRTDGGGEFTGIDFETWLITNGTRHETSIPHSPQQNGVSERGNRTLMEATRSLMHSKAVPKELWAEAANCAAYTLNRILTATRDRTPREVWHGRKPDLSGMRIFGSRSFAQIPDQNRKKLDPKARECILVGYPTTQKGYRLWDPVARRILISRDVRRKPKLHHTTGTADQRSECWRGK